MNPILRAIVRGEPLTGRHVLISAHPDDETISCAALLCSMPTATIVQLTGWPASRMDERTNALLAGQWPVTIWEGGATARLAFRDAARLLALVESVCQDGVDVLWAHPYEGGHLDHDTAAWLSQTVATRHPLAQRMEFASYHMTADAQAFGVFWPDDSKRAAEVPLHGARWERKAAAIRAYDSQGRILRKFTNWPFEVYREAPTYDFSQPSPPPRSRWDVKGYQPSTREWRDAIAMAHDWVAA